MNKFENVQKVTKDLERGDGNAAFPAFADLTLSQVRGALQQVNRQNEQDIHDGTSKQKVSVREEDQDGLHKVVISAPWVNNYQGALLRGDEDVILKYTKDGDRVSGSHRDLSKPSFPLADSRWVGDKK